MSTHSHDDVSRVMHRCVNDGIDPIAAANKIKGLVVRSPSEYEFSAFDKIWSEAIAMAKSWEVMDERHGRLANLFAELSRLRDSVSNSSPPIHLESNLLMLSTASLLGRLRAPLSRRRRYIQRRYHPLFTPVIINMC